MIRQLRLKTICAWTFLAGISAVGLAEPPAPTGRLGTEIGNASLANYPTVYKGISGGQPFEVRSYSNGQFLVEIKGKSTVVSANGGAVQMPSGDKINISVVDRNKANRPGNYFPDEGWRALNQGASDFPGFSRPLGQKGRSLQILVVPSDEQLITIAQWSAEEMPLEFRMLYNSAKGLYVERP